MNKKSQKSFDQDWLNNYSETLLQVKEQYSDHKTAIEIAGVIVRARLEVEPICGTRAALDATVSAIKTSCGYVSASVDIDLDLVPPHLQNKVRKYAKARS